MKDKGHLGHQIQPSDMKSSPMVCQQYWPQWNLFSYRPSSIPWQHWLLSMAKEGKALSMLSEGFLGQHSCSLGPRCIPTALSSPLTLPGSAGVWGRALEHGNHSQLEEEKSLNCWITPRAPISVQGRCGERACSCHQIRHLPLITYDQLIFILFCM